MKRVSRIKKTLLSILLCCFNMLVVADGIYIWEYNRSGERSCCLALSGTDICNPQTPCTRNVFTDLTGINDYISRLLGLEKAGSLSYATILTQAQYYIRHVLSAPFTSLSYRYDEYRDVKFFHEIVDVPKTNEKTAKASSTTTSTSTVVKKDDPVFQYMVKLGLAHEWNKK